MLCFCDNSHHNLSLVYKDQLCHPLMEPIWPPGGGGCEGERDIHRNGERQRHRDEKTERLRHTDREIWKDRDTETERWRDTERNRNRKTLKKKQRHRSTTSRQFSYFLHNVLRCSQDLTPREYNLSIIFPGCLCFLCHI